MRKYTHSTTRHSNQCNLPVKVKPFPSEASKMAPRSKIAMSSKGTPYKIVFHRYVICPFINYVIWLVGRPKDDATLQKGGEGSGKVPKKMK